MDRTIALAADPIADSERFMNDTPILPDVVAYAMDGGGGGRAIDVAALASASSDTDAGFIWLHARRDAAWTQEWLGSDEAALDSDVRDALTAEDTRPRCSVHGEGVILNLRGVNLNPGAEPDDMVSVRLWIEARRVVGVWLRPLRAVRDLADAIERGQAPLTPGEFAAKLALRLVDRMEPTVADLNERVDDLEERVIDETSTALWGDLADIRHTAIALRRFIAPQRDALSSLEIEDVSWLTNRDRIRLREAADRTTRLAEELEAVRERAAVIHDQLMERRSEQMNRRMLILSIVAAIFLPLGLLTGLLGVNVGGIPGATAPQGFWVVCALLLVIALLLMWLVRKKDLL